MIFNYLLNNKKILKKYRIYSLYIEISCNACYNVIDWVVLGY